MTNQIINDLLTFIRSHGHSAEFEFGSIRIVAGNGSISQCQPTWYCVRRALGY